MYEWYLTPYRKHKKLLIVDQGTAFVIFIDCLLCTYDNDIFIFEACMLNARLFGQSHQELYESCWNSNSFQCLLLTLLDLADVVDRVLS